MLLAAHLAGIGQASGTGVGLVHAIGHALGTRGRLAHGTALAAVMPEVLDFYGPLRHRELALVGVALGVASPADAEAVAARAAIDALERFLAGLGQRRTLASWASRARRSKRWRTTRRPIRRSGARRGCRTAASCERSSPAWPAEIARPQAADAQRQIRRCRARGRWPAG